MEIIYTTDSEIQEENNNRCRWEEVAILEAYREISKQGISLLQFAKDKGIPESTIRHWVVRSQKATGPSAWRDFFESTEGLQLLHQINVAAIFVFTQIAGGGVRTVQMFHELSGLWRFIAASYGTLQTEVQEMENQIVEFGKTQKEHLATNMPKKQITLTEDETFHSGQTCLVAIEPVSNFILLEEYSADRQAATWDKKIMAALDGLSVDVIQVTSDMAKALINHACNSLKAHHSPDLFHLQQDISRATSLTLKKYIKQAQNKLKDAQEFFEKIQEEAQAYENRKYKWPGRPVNYEARIEQAKNNVEAAEAEVKESYKQKEIVRESARNISNSYHPFDTKTGEARDAFTVEKELNDHFDIIEKTAKESGLGYSCFNLLQKARRLLPQMVATITFVHTFIQSKVEELKLGEILTKIILEYLIPLFYLEKVASKAKTAEIRDKLLNNINIFKEKYKWAIAILATLRIKEREALEYTALSCAQIFQRSSSNVEGRNGVLALRHHSFHNLSSRKLQALTVVHNFAIRHRDEGTTPAENFFEQSHENLFEYLLIALPPPKRPAEKRSRLLN